MTVTATPSSINDPNRYIPWHQMTDDTMNTLSDNTKRYALDVLRVANTAVSLRTQRDQLENSLNEVNVHLQETQNHLVEVENHLTSGLDGINFSRKIMTEYAVFKVATIGLVIILVFIAVNCIAHECGWWRFLKR